MCGANRPDPSQGQRDEDRIVCGANRPDPSQGQRDEGRTVCGANGPDPSQGQRNGGQTAKAPRPTSELRHWKARSAGVDPDEVARARARLADEISADGRLNIRGLMCPRWRAEQHPAAPMLRQYAKHGCPVSVEDDWTLEMLDAAVAQGPPASALKDDAIEQMQSEAREKESQGFAKIFKWKDLRKNPPRSLKLLPLAMIPHKSRKYRVILDLSFALMMMGRLLLSVNDATRRQAPEEAMDHKSEACCRASSRRWQTRRYRETSC